jgi:hypothetical protein
MFSPCSKEARVRKCLFPILTLSVQGFPIGRQHVEKLADPANIASNQIFEFLLDHKSFFIVISDSQGLWKRSKLTVPQQLAQSKGMQSGNTRTLMLRQL